MKAEQHQPTQVRIGVVGAGWWSTFAHLPSLSRNPDVELVGIADPNLEKARKAASRFGSRAVFGDHRNLLESGVDGVVIATPHHTHFELARDALLAGCDVMVEKPMVVDPMHGHQLVEIAMQQGRNLHVGYPYLFTRHSQLLRERLREGALGTVQTVTSLFATSPYQFYRGNTEWAGEAPGAMWGPERDTYSNPARGGGQLLTQVTHSASLMFYLTDLVPHRVQAFSDQFDTDVDVWNVINFQTRGGATGSFSSTGTIPLTHSPVEEHRIFGSKGFACMDTARGNLSIHYEDGTTSEETPLTDEERYPVGRPAQQLVDTLLGRGPVVASGELGLKTVEFLAAARESAASGRIVEMS